AIDAAADGYGIRSSCRSQPTQVHRHVGFARGNSDHCRATAASTAPSATASPATVGRLSGGGVGCRRPGDSPPAIAPVAQATKNEEYEDPAAASFSGPGIFFQQ